MRQFIIKHWLTSLLILAGFLGGFLYWKFVGCNSGSCPITSNWHSSLLVGGLLGFIVRDFFPKDNSGKDSA